MRRPFCAAPTHRTSPRNAHARALSLLVAALLSVCAPHRIDAQSLAAKTPAPANATVSGRVTTTDGKPAANITVALSPADFTPDRNRIAARATTDAEGRYKITNVAAGRYRLLALAPLYTSPEDRGSSPFNSGKMVTVGASETVENIDVSLVRGGVITGRVMSPEGKPVIGERVSVTNADQPNAAGPAAWVISPFDFETDDRGIYRIYGVPPGRYVVSVGQARDAGMITVGPTAAQYQRTFYPNTTDASQAKPVEVTSGSEASGVDIDLAEAPKSYEAHGKIVDESGNPVAGIGYGHGAVRVNQPVIGAWGTDGSTTDEAGGFVVRNLMPGRYAVFAASDFGGSSLEVYSDAVQFEVTDANVEGLVIKVHRGASISGSVVVEGTTDRSVLAKIAQLNLGANVRPVAGAPPDQVSAPNFAQGRVNADGTFRLTGLRPGKVVLNLFAFGETRGFTLLGVQRAGADASSGIDVAEGEQVTGVRVRVGYGSSVIRGQLDVRSAGEPATLPPGARVNVTARRNGTQMPGGVAGGEVDSRGHFVIEGLMGGEYELIVNVFVPRPPGTPAPLRTQPLRQTITVPENGEIVVSLIYDLSKQMERNP
jgi:protocatechuate 3,4-dioxygenase beta subunit